MSLPVPNLDDRTFKKLVEAAQEHIKNSKTTWTDLSVHDPGMALVEAFAYLTEVMIYRLNLLPEKAYVSFLNLLGVSRHPPSAAWADVTFVRAESGSAADAPAVTIPAGTRVAAVGGVDPQPVVFITTESVVLPPGAAEISVRVHHCELVEGELIGTGNGQPGQTMQAARAPVVHTTEARDLILGVEVPRGSVEIGAAAREFDGKVFEIWQPVGAFTSVSPNAKVYLIDRAAGVITFAPELDVRHPVSGQEPDPPPQEGPPPVAPHPTEKPAEPVVLAAVPPAGREVRLWYRAGGGPSGNVAAGTLTNLRDPVAGVKVTGNPSPARGGRPLEALESALLRGPYEFFSRQRAVTARDFEMLATAGSGAVARARAFTRAEVLKFAQPGEVEVVLVPDVPEKFRERGRLSLDVLQQHQVELLRQRAQSDLDMRRALGTSVRVSWAGYKAVSITGTVVVRPEEDADAVRRRIHDRLYQTLSPLPTDLNVTGWRFGEPLRVSNVYRMLEQAEPGVRYVSKVRLTVKHAPDKQVRTVAADHYQPLTAYAGAGEVLFRSTNAAQGWEDIIHFPGETVERVVPAPAAARPGIEPRPGWLAVVTQRTSEGGATGSRVHVSKDLGNTWDVVAELEPRIHDLAWIDRGGSGSLLLATDTGLYEVPLVLDAVPLQVLVEPADADRGFYAVRAFVSERGVPAVALAAQTQYGVYLSLEEGRPGTFKHVGLTNVDTRTLAVHYDGPATVLWAGVGEADPNRPGQGCFRTRLYEADVVWQGLQTGWVGGTCRALAFDGRSAIAASHSGGVLRLDTAAVAPVWQPVQVNGGLPLRDRARFEPIDSIAVMAGPATTDPTAAKPDRLFLAGGVRGVYRSDDALRWAASASQETSEVVTVPDTWLICSGEHQIEVIKYDAPASD